ncbi:MAG TPA: hypothetical protein VKU39_21275 [Streptosporangiaceae bacterium]|nr:hypothetical protein [Streptosporangiaceae bacterium]
MHPEIALTLAAQRKEELRRDAARARRPARKFPGLHLSCSRLTSGNSSSLLIVISAHRA